MQEQALPELRPLAWRGLMLGVVAFAATFWLLREPRGSAGLPEFASFLEHGDPVAGRLAPEKLQRLFGDDAAEVRSAALMRVGSDAILAIGSADADRFHPGMGTLFLRMMGEALSTGLARYAR